MAIDTEDYENISSNLDNYSDISYDQKNIIDWHFPLIDLCEDNQWLLFENDISSNESEICYIKNKLLREFQTEIFLQYPIIIQVMQYLFKFIIEFTLVYISYFYIILIEIT